MENWWESEEAGKYLESMMKDGANINFQEFSKLDSRVFLKRSLVANYMGYFPGSWKCSLKNPSVDKFLDQILKINVKLYFIN